jgi:hypothetical protein
MLDARGQFFDVRFKTLARLCRTSSGDLKKQMQLAQTRAWSKPGTRWGQITAALISVAAFGGAVTLHLVLSPAEFIAASRYDAILLLVGGLGSVVAMIVGLWRMVGFSERSGQELIRLRLCASCGYDLRGSKVEPDGCTVCPECGAAWRLPDSG